VKESAQFLSKEYSQGVKVWGTQTLGRWESSLAWMKAQGLVKAPDAARAHFSNAFLATEKAPSSKTPPAKKP
jgi:hypothetical protein